MKRQCAARSMPGFGAMDGLGGCGVFGVFGSYLKSTVFGRFKNALREGLQALGGSVRLC